MVRLHAAPSRWEQIRGCNSPCCSSVRALHFFFECSFIQCFKNSVSSQVPFSDNLKCKNLQHGFFFQVVTAVTGMKQQVAVNAQTSELLL